MALTPQSTPDAPQQTARRPGAFWSRLHFLIRFVGLTGLLVACVGLVLAGLDHMLTSWQDAANAGRAALEGQVVPVRTWLVLGGTAALLVALVVEVFAVLRLAAGRRSAAGASALVQVALAVALLVGVNYLAFRHPVRVDLTRAQSFTLPADVRTGLAKLKEDTTIVVYLRHKTVGALTARPDRFDYAAERKVVEKVKDLASQLREVGPRFKVEVLDVESENYTDTLDRLTKDAPELRKAIEAAPEDTIFFHSSARQHPKAPERVQQISFNDFYRLDKTASRAEDNLVLRSAGVRPITNRILNLEARRPRVGILVFHEALSTEGAFGIYTLAGARKALAAEGFGVRDIISKRESTQTRDFEPAADTLEDARLGRLRSEVDELNDVLRRKEQEVQALDKLIAELPKADLERLKDLIIEYEERFVPPFAIAGVTERSRPGLVRLFTNQRNAAQEDIRVNREAKEAAQRDLDKLDVDRIKERQREPDLGAKLGRALADCDLLLIPRLTILPQGLPLGQPQWHDLDARQAAALKEFLSQGKPVLACFGPRNIPLQRSGPPQPDEAEKLLADLGIHFGKRTVLYQVETRTFSERRDSPFRRGRPLLLPPLRLESGTPGSTEYLVRNDFGPLKEPLALLGAGTAGPLQALPFAQPEAPRKPNPLRESLRLADREAGGGLDLRLRFARPVWLDPQVARRLPYQAELLSTSPESWNDEQPFSTPLRPVPRFEPPRPEEPDNNTPNARRRGPFTVGVAFETPVPRTWLPDSITTPPVVRVAAIGHGGAFTGDELTPANERLLLDTCNWLLGRDDRLAQDSPEWSYPRVAMSEQTRAIWDWAMWLGLPVLFAYLGLLVLLARRVR